MKLRWMICLTLLHVVTVAWAQNQKPLRDTIRTSPQVKQKVPIETPDPAQATVGREDRDASDPRKENEEQRGNVMIVPERTSSSAGSPAVLSEDGERDGTNTRQRAIPNEQAGSPITAPRQKPAQDPNAEQRKTNQAAHPAEQKNQPAGQTNKAGVSRQEKQKKDSDDDRRSRREKRRKKHQD